MFAWKLEFRDNSWIPQVIAAKHQSHWEMKGAETSGKRSILGQKKPMFSFCTKQHSSCHFSSELQRGSSNSSYSKPHLTRYKNCMEAFGRQNVKAHLKVKKSQKIVKSGFNLYLSFVAAHIWFFLTYREGNISPRSFFLSSFVSVFVLSHWIRARSRATSVGLFNSVNHIHDLLILAAFDLWECQKTIIPLPATSSLWPTAVQTFMAREDPSVFFSIHGFVHMILAGDSSALPCEVKSRGFRGSVVNVSHGCSECTV